MHIQLILVTLRFCSSQLTRIHYFTNPSAGSLGPTLISVRSVVQRTVRTAATPAADTTTCSPSATVT